MHFLDYPESNAVFRVVEKTRRTHGVFHTANKKEMEAAYGKQRPTKWLSHWQTNGGI